MKLLFFVCFLVLGAFGSILDIYPFCVKIKEIEENMPDGISDFVKNMGLASPKGKRLICTVHEYFWWSRSFSKIEPRNANLYIDVASGKAYGWSCSGGLSVSPGVSNNVLDAFVKISNLTDLSKYSIGLVNRDEPSVINGFKAISRDGSLPNKIWLKDSPFTEGEFPFKTWNLETDFLRELENEEDC